MFFTFTSVVELEAMKTTTERTTEILDASYKKANLEKSVTEEYQHLNKWEKKLLLKLLREYGTLSDGTLGDFKMSPVLIKVKENAQPTHSKAFLIPKIHEETLKKEIQ
eukprot:9287694-Ditylum_brightwellii.AAC.1